MPTATTATPAGDTPVVHANTSRDFPTKGQAEAFVDGIIFVGDDRVTVLDTKVVGYGQTTVHLLDERR